MMLVESDPARGGPYQQARSGALRIVKGLLGLVTVPAPGRRRGTARCKGRTMLPNPHQITGGMDPDLDRKCRF